MFMCIFYLYLSYMLNVSLNSECSYEIKLIFLLKNIQNLAPNKLCSRSNATEGNSFTLFPQS
jgi:hypothetical protein